MYRKRHDTYRVRSVLSVASGIHWGSWNVPLQMKCVSGGNYCTWKSCRKETTIKMNFDSIWATTAYQAETTSMSNYRAKRKQTSDGTNSIWLVHKLWIWKQGEIKLENRLYSCFIRQNIFLLKPKAHWVSLQIWQRVMTSKIHTYTYTSYHNSLGLSHPDHHVSLWLGLSTSSSHNLHFPLPKIQFHSFLPPVTEDLPSDTLHWDLKYNMILNRKYLSPEGRRVGKWEKQVTGIKEYTCHDEQRVINRNVQSLDFTPETNITMYVN